MRSSRIAAKSSSLVGKWRLTVPVPTPARRAISGTGRPDQRGRTAVITGANTGLGFQTAKLLAEHGAAVVLACRDAAKAANAAARITASAPHATVRTLQLDLASLASIRRAAEQLR